MTTLREYRINLGWSASKLAQEAGISPPIIRRAENGMPVQAETAKAIADALSKAYEKDIKPLDIKDLNIL